jgi:hypothetical protein
VPWTFATAIGLVLILGVPIVWAEPDEGHLGKIG